jgi:hypothetical protein
LQKLKKSGNSSKNYIHKNEGQLKGIKEQGRNICLFKNPPNKRGKVLRGI